MATSFAAEMRELQKKPLAEAARVSDETVTAFISIVKNHIRAYVGTSTLRTSAEFSSLLSPLTKQQRDRARQCLMDPPNNLDIREDTYDGDVFWVVSWA